MRPLRHPVFVQLLCFGMAVNSCCEQLLHTLLPLLQPLLLLRPKRLPALCLRIRACAPRVLYQRLLQLGREPGIEEPTPMRLRLLLALPPAAVVDVCRPLEVLVTHLLGYAWWDGAGKDQGVYLYAKVESHGVESVIRTCHILDR